MRPAVTAVLQRVFPPALLATARSRLSAIWRVVFALAGKYEPLSSSEKEFVCVDRVRFSGDSPVQIAGGGFEQGRMAFRKKRAICEQVSNLIVTPKGAGWSDGRLYERYSAGAPGLRMFLENHKPTQIVDAGVYIQAAHKDTYGDWVSEYLTAIARVHPLSAPLFLPASLAARSYVRRDLSMLDVDFVSVSEPVEISSATVLRQQKFFVHFDAPEVDALRVLLGIDPVEPRPGGIVYFSRRGEVSEVAQRSYPHDVIEQFVVGRGGRVIETAHASPEDYEAVAYAGETVIFDHGSAFYNALRWRAKRAVEIISDDWWNSAFLMLGKAMGIEDYTIIRGSLSEAHVKQRLEEALRRPLDPACET